MSTHALFVEAVRSAENLPPKVRSHAANVTRLREQPLNASHLMHFDTLIGLNKHWQNDEVNRMRQRQAALQPFCGITLLFGRVKVSLTGQEYEVVVHPATKAVIDWEEFIGDTGI